MDSKCLRWLRIFICFRWVDHIMSYKARAIVLLLVCGLTRALRKIIDNWPAFFCARS